MADNKRRNDPNTTDHEIVPSKPDDEARNERDRDAGQIRTSGTNDREHASAGRMPARRNN